MSAAADLKATRQQEQHTINEQITQIQDSTNAQIQPLRDRLNVLDLLIQELDSVLQAEPAAEPAVQTFGEASQDVAVEQAQ